jgi:hypothetical protein
VRRPCFNAICRYKRICIKNEMAFSEINARMVLMFKKEEVTGCLVFCLGIQQHNSINNWKIISSRRN